jgi:hypothetical protein
MKRTIPEIAEELRSHINNDNDAPRLIAEHVLPLLADTIAQSKLSHRTADTIRNEANRMIGRLNPSVP